MWYIPDDQIVKIQNRMSDIRNTPPADTIAFFAATYELLGTLDAILFDQRNMERRKPTTRILPEDKNAESKDEKKTSTKSKDNQKKMSYFIKPDENQPAEKKMNSHERRKERRRLEREAAKAESNKETDKEDNKQDTVQVNSDDSSNPWDGVCGWIEKTYGIKQED